MAAVGPDIFKAGSPIYIQYGIRDGTLAQPQRTTPASLAITISRPDGSIAVNLAAMTTVTGQLGSYSYDLVTETTDQTGTWTASLVATAPNGRTTPSQPFNLFTLN